MAKSIKKRIDELVNKLGEIPPPNAGTIKGELLDIGSSVEALEEGAAIRDAEAKVTILESENANLKTELKLLKGEVETFRAERKKQEQESKRADIPDIQFEILKRLPSESESSGLGFQDLASAFNIPVYEVEVHVDALAKAGLARPTREHRTWVAYRTMAGNKFMLAKRLAGEEQAPERKYPDLPDIEERMLAMMIGENEGVREEFIHGSLENLWRVTITLEKVKWLLKTSLKDKGFAYYDPEEATYGMGYSWFITDRGTEYFAERNKL
jgi:hypothetical protein